MLEFTYRARSSKGRTTTGRIVAATQSQALAELRRQGLIPWELRATSPSKIPDDKSLAGQKRSKPKASSILEVLHQPIHLQRIPSQRQLSAFMRQLAGLLVAGLPLDRSLALLARTTRSRRFAQMITAVHSEVQSGAPLSLSLASQLPTLPGYAQSMLQAGEASGQAEDALRAIADVMDRNESIRSLLRTSLAYPVFMLGVSLIAVVILLTFVIPRFLGIFDMWDTELPVPTRVLISFSQGFNTWGAKK